ncbi:hypothetical protein [Archaeoglobus sp.]
MICPRCGGKLQATPNPNKLQCRECGRVFKNYSMRYYRCDRCVEPCFVVSAYMDKPDTCPYGFKSCQWDEVSAQRFIRQVARGLVI